MTRSERIAAMLALLLEEPGRLSLRLAMAVFAEPAWKVRPDLRLITEHLDLVAHPLLDGELAWTLRGRSPPPPLSGPVRSRREPRPDRLRGPGAAREPHRATAAGRIVIAFRLLLRGEAVSAAELVRATGSRPEGCAASLAVLRRHLPLGLVMDGKRRAWVLRHEHVRRGATLLTLEEKEQRAAELALAGKSWTEMARELGYREGSSALKAAKRWSARAGDPR